MTQTLEKAFQEASKLPGGEQEVFAGFILDELAFRAALREGIEAADRGEVVPLEEVKKNDSPMGFKIVFTKPAIADLDGLVTRISRDNPGWRSNWVARSSGRLKNWMNVHCSAAWCRSSKLKPSVKSSTGRIGLFIACARSGS